MEQYTLDYGVFFHNCAIPNAIAEMSSSTVDKLRSLFDECLRAPRVSADTRAAFLDTLHSLSQASHADLLEMRRVYTQYDFWFMRGNNDGVMGTIAFLGVIDVRRLGPLLLQSILNHKHIDVQVTGKSWNFVALRVVMRRYRDSV